MINYLKINWNDHMLIMDKAFAREATIAGTPEYNQLQACRRDYPEFTVITRHIKKSENKKTYKGLTYGYMEYYIKTHEPEETRSQVLNELDEMHTIAACHSRGYRYPVIKRWFLKKYPQIAEFGITSKDEDSSIIFMSDNKTELAEAC